MYFWYLIHKKIIPKENQLNHQGKGFQQRYQEVKDVCALIIL